MVEKNIKEKIILLGICTYNRNDLLDNALKHIALLTSPEGARLEVILLDNNPDGRASEIYSKYETTFPYKLHYELETKPGIAAARNSVLRKAIEIKADYIAFMDDDEYPLPEWISELYTTMVQFDADAATSYAVFTENGVEQKIPFNVKRRKMGSKRNIFITNSVIFKTSIVTESDIWFDETLGHLGGSDVDFSGRASSKGYKFVWCNKTLIYEIVPENRQTLEWKLDRAFKDGYLKIFKYKKDHKIKNTTYLKIIFDLALFSSLTLICSIFLPFLKEYCLRKTFYYIAKLKSLYTEGIYEHYKRVN